METQSCYVCGKYFEDKVKLGLHLTPCYNEAVSVRKELWHPHPLDLVDEQRYTEYMKGRFKEREHRILDAQRKGINLVSADDFEAMRGTLGPNARGKPSRPPTRERAVGAMSQIPPQPCGAAEAMAPPLCTNPTQASQIAQPVRVVATGVTMLRNELHSEIELLKQLRTEEQQNAAARQQEFHNLINNFNAVRSSGAELRVVPPAASNALPPPPANNAVPPPLDEVHSRNVQAPASQHVVSAPTMAPYSRVGAPPGGLSPGVHQAMHSSPVSGDNEELPDGRVRCGTCGKFFGKKGFQVHAQRCYRGVDDFTFSRDARFERNHPAPNQPIPQLQDERYKEQGGGGGGPQATDQAWTQFMMTYPRPVLDEKPKTDKERNQAAVDAKKKAEYAMMVAREMSGAPAPPAEEREPTVPCGKCGRYFYTSRVAKHEATCVSKKKR